MTPKTKMNRDNKPAGYRATMMRKSHSATRESLLAGDVEEKTLLMQKAWEVIAYTPKGRSEKVAALREIIRQGNYKIDCDKLSNILLLEVLTLVIHRSLYEHIGRDH